MAGVKEGSWEKAGNGQWTYKVDFDDPLIKKTNKIKMFFETKSVNVPNYTGEVVIMSRAVLNDRELNRPEMNALFRQITEAAFKDKEEINKQYFQV